MNSFLEHLLHGFETPLKNPVLVFSLILFIILLAPILLKKLNVPGIIGLIVSGIIIGPFGLNILAKNSAIELFSTIGLLYIMFIAGLELDLNEFRANRNKSMVFGFFTFIIPLAIGFPVCHYILNYSYEASFLTASMFATHTLVAYPIVSKLGISKNQAVAITVGGTILTDTAVLIILAVIMGSHTGSLNMEFWIRMLVSLTLFSLIMFLIIPRIAKWFFRKLESEKHAHYIFVLSVVFFSAFLAEMAGVEPIIGAFVAGLALNKLIPHSSALMNRIEFIGNSLFIPFFLISVGMLVDVSVIFSGPAAIFIAITLSLAAISGKWLAALFTQLIFGYSKEQRKLIFGLSSAHAAATLAVILVGYKAGIIDDNILNGTIILILITCVVASIATERAGKKILINEESETSSDLSTVYSSEHILIPFSDFSEIERILALVFLIKDKKSVNPVTILTVVPNNEEAESNILKARHKLAEFVKIASATEMKVNLIARIDHNIASGVIRTSREIVADIIILSWPSNPGMFEKLIGEKVESIIGNVDKTVIVSRFPGQLVAMKRIVLITPPFAERENGFKIWVSKMSKLALELSCQIMHYGTEATNRSLRQVLKTEHLNVTVQQSEFSDWDDFLILSRDIKENDLIAIVSARKVSVSYLPQLEQIPLKIEKHFSSNNCLIVYPQQFENTDELDSYESLSAEPFVKSLEAIGKLGKGIKNIFR